MSLWHRRKQIKAHWRLNQHEKNNMQIDLSAVSFYSLLNEATSMINYDEQTAVYNVGTRRQQYRVCSRYFFSQSR